VFLIVPLGTRPPSEMGMKRGRKKYATTWQKKVYFIDRSPLSASWPLYSQVTPSYPQVAPLFTQVTPPYPQVSVRQLKNPSLQ
ncbi:hypothetical protein, partial [Neobacillus rhizosphaerae]|uniref:hypothetical protein n=1 Tax=Neobacillus rhizosphaerae TaxID=2880965 RepID=UPI00200D8768